jgi:hypothetical protein
MAKKNVHYLLQIIISCLFEYISIELVDRILLLLEYFCFNNQVLHAYIFMKGNWDKMEVLRDKYPIRVLVFYRNIIRSTKVKKIFDYNTNLIMRFIKMWNTEINSTRSDMDLEIKKCLRLRLLC